MGQGRPLSGGANYGAAHARIDLDLSSLTSAAQVARAAGDATAKAIQQSLKIVQNEQKITLEQAKQATAAVQAQQAQITATSRAESAERKAAAVSEATVIQQQAKAASVTVAEEQKRQTAAFKQELKERDRAQRQSQVSAGGFAQGAASFVGAAIGGPIGGLIGAATMGNPAIAAGVAVNQAARFAIDAAQIATAYNRQNLAALQLAGSQAKLNSLMEVYDKDTGKIIPKAQEIADVTKLESLGFADNAKQLDTFTRAARGIALAQNEPQSAVNEQLTTAIISQRRQSLRTLGLEYEQVKAREAELQKADKSLTDQQAYGQAVMEQAIQKFGGLANSAAGAGTGLERLAKSWDDLKLSIGQDANSPVNQSAGFFADILESNAQYQKTKQEVAANPSYKLPIGASQAQKNAYLNETAAQEQGAAAKRFWDTAMDGLTQAISASQGIRYTPKPYVAGPSFNGPVPSWMTSATPNANPSRIPSRFTGDQEDALVSWNQKRVAIEHDTQAAVAAEARSWGNQRLQAERAYTKTSVREAQDWSRQQSRTIEDFQESQSKNAKDYAKQQARSERDLGRTVAQEQADAADKVADIRKDSAKQLKDIEESYRADQIKSARHFKNEQMDAAGSLDAKRVAELQRSYGEQQQDAKEAHDKQVKDAKAQLGERLSDEAKSLQKSIDQQRTALSQREADQAEDYDQSNKDAQAQFTKEQTRAVQDRGVRLERMATDQQDQLTAIDNAHKANMADIAQRADDEKKAIQTILTDAHIAVKGFVDNSVEDSIKAYDKYYGHMDDLLSGKIKPGDTPATGIPATQSSPAGYASGGYVQRGGMASVHAGEFMLSRGMMMGNQPIPASVRSAVGANGGGNRSVTINQMHLHGIAADDPRDFGRRVWVEINKWMEAAS